MYKINTQISIVLYFYTLAMNKSQSEIKKAILFAIS